MEESSPESGMGDISEEIKKVQGDSEMIKTPNYDEEMSSIDKRRRQGSQHDRDQEKVSPDVRRFMQDDDGGELKLKVVKIDCAAN